MLDVDPVRLGLSLALSVLIGGLGYWRGSLAGSGWLGAIFIGTATAGFGGWDWGLLVVVFFVTSSALSHWRRETKVRAAEGKTAKGERRDLAQTLANGGLAATLALVYAFDPEPALFVLALGALATVTADTWATELGSLSRSAPRLVTTGRVVDPGTSGGVTFLGLAASAAGALAIGLAAVGFQWLIGYKTSGMLVVAALGGGLAGALVDSILGATVQALYRCSACGTETEQIIHNCGRQTEHLRGWTWLDNDRVNFASSAVGATICLVVWTAMG